MSKPNFTKEELKSFVDFFYQHGYLDVKFETRLFICDECGKPVISDFADDCMSCDVCSEYACNRCKGKAYSLYLASNQEDDQKCNKCISETGLIK